MLLTGMLDTVAAEYPNKVATVFNASQITYREFLERVNRVSNALLSLNYYKGDRAAILMKNIPQYFELYFGIFGIGGIAVPLNTRLSPNEITYIINHSGANTLIFQDEFSDTICSIKQYLPGIKNYIVVGDTVDDAANYEELIRTSTATEIIADVSEDDVAMLCYTSGTTGKPKGVMSTHKNMTTICGYQLIELPRYRHYVGMGLFPYFHIGVMMAFNKIAMGMTCVFADFHPLKIAELIEKHKINDLDITATQLRIFANTPGVETYNLSSLRTVSTGGGFSSAQTLRNFFSYFTPNHDIVIANIYGMTENTAHVMSNIISPHTLKMEESKLKNLPGITASGLGAGKPIYGIRVLIVDDSGNQVPDNKVGEILVKGDTVMKGYWQQPEKTAQALAGGWYHTGDLGVRMEGKYFIVDRKKDMILSGDENVYPAEVESVIAAHPGVMDIALFGIPDEQWGESVTAVVVPNKDMNVTEQELRDFCRGKIAGYKIPKTIHFVDHIPRNAAGKILRHKIKEAFKC